MLDPVWTSEDGAAPAAPRNVVRITTPNGQGRSHSALGISNRWVESHLCCGAAGTYSVLQPTLAYQLRDRKLGQLNELQPQSIVSATIGCIQHLQTGTSVSVKHWGEVLDEAMVAPAA